MAMTEVYQLDLDEEILSHLADPESVNALWAENLNPALIEDEFAAEVWDWAIAHLRTHGKPPTPSVLADEFELDFAEPLTSPGDLMDRLRERFMRNSARAEMEKLGNAYKDNPAQVPELMLKLGRELSSKLGNRGEAFGTGDFERAKHRYEQQVLAGPGASFGWKELDDQFYGMRGMTFLIASPKTYKSWITVHSVVENIKNGQHVWLYSLELPADESYWRVACGAAGIPYWKYLRHQLGAAELADLKEATELLDGCGVFRIVKPERGRRGIEDMVERARDTGADVIYIDQLQYIENDRGRALGSLNDTGEYFDVINAGRDLSDDGPLWIVHQFNRAARFSDEMPDMSLAKGSSAVEECATLALGLWANKEMKKSNQVELGVLASRNYTDKAWEIGVELTRGCDFELLREAVHDDE
jgi:hypothetical protein